MSASGTLRAGWRAVLAAPERILVTTIAISVPAIALHVLLQHLIGVVVAGGSECPRQFLGTSIVADCGPTNGRAQLALVIGLFAFFVIGQLVVAGLYRAFLDVVDGQPADNPLRSMLSAVPTALFLGVVLTLSTLFLLLPGLVLGFFTRYTLLFVVERDLGPIAATKASVRFCAQRLGSELGFVLRAVGVLLLGFLVLGAGLFVAVPVVLIAQTLRYRSVLSPPVPEVAAWAT